MNPMKLRDIKVKQEPSSISELSDAFFNASNSDAESYSPSRTIIPRRKNRKRVLSEQLAIGLLNQKRNKAYAKLYPSLTDEQKLLFDTIQSVYDAREKKFADDLRDAKTSFKACRQQNKELLTEKYAKNAALKKAKNELALAVRELTELERNVQSMAEVEGSSQQALPNTEVFNKRDNVIIKVETFDADGSQ